MVLQVPLQELGHGRVVTQQKLQPQGMMTRPELRLGSAGRLGNKYTIFSLLLPQAVLNQKSEGNEAWVSFLGHRVWQRGAENRWKRDNSQHSYWSPVSHGIVFADFLILAPKRQVLQFPGPSTMPHIYINIK